MRLTLHTILLLISISLLLANCSFEPTTTIDPTTGEPIGNGDQDPFLYFDDDESFVKSDAEFRVNDTFYVRFIATKNESPLQTVNIYQDNDLLVDPTVRLRINQIPASSSTINLTGSEKDSLAWELLIVAQDFSGDALYEFEVIDEADKLSNLTIKIITTRDPEFSFMGVDSFDNQGLPIFITTQGSRVDVPLTIDPGDKILANISVFELDEFVSTARLRLDGNEFESNPQKLTDSDTLGFGKILQITAHDDISDVIYTLALTDMNQNIFYQDLVISVN